MSYLLFFSPKMKMIVLKKDKLLKTRCIFFKIRLGILAPWDSFAQTTSPFTIDKQTEDSCLNHQGDEASFENRAENYWGPDKWRLNYRRYIITFHVNCS